MDSLGLSLEPAQPDMVRSSVVPLPRIRTGRRADLDALYELELNVFNTDAASRRSISHSLRSPWAAVLVAEMDGVLAGSAVIHYQSAVARLYSIAVAQEYRRRWIGALLLIRCERLAIKRGCRVMRLEVRDGNYGAIRFYERANYHCIGEREGYYRDGADALRFEKTL